MNSRRILTFLILTILAMSIYMVAAQPGSISNLKNITYADSYINWTWQDPGNANFSHVMVYINGQFKTNVTSGIEYYNATNLGENTNYAIGTHTVDTNNSVNWTWKNHTARTASNMSESDTIPPASVTNLKNDTYARTYINWTWDDPSDADFAKVMVYINGTFKTNVTRGVKHYSATNLTSNTSYKISTHTVDNSGNINNTWKNHTVRTASLDTTPPASVTNLKNDTYAITYINWTWNDPSDTDFEKVMIYINGQFKTNISEGIEFYNAVGLEAGTKYTIGTHTVDDSGNINNTWVNSTANTSYPGPKITIIKEPEKLNITIGESLYFDISIDQRANVTWRVDDNIVKSGIILANKSSNYTFKPDTKGTHNVKVTAKNGNGTDVKNWSMTVYSKTYMTGNRIWDGSKPSEYSLTYTWNPMSFSGFYYNIDSNVGGESITMTLDYYQDRSINEGKLTYSTSPQEVGFDYSNFGRYQVIGFMADKYFAGYTHNTTIPNPKETVKKTSTMGQGQLHKVLLDDDNKRTLAVGSTISLKEGYVLKAKDIGDRTMLISLLKDGNEVDAASLLNAGDTYVYSKKVGSVGELPIIIVRFDSVFMGREVQMAVLKGMFQISENYAKISSGDRYGIMKITETGQDKIAMKNDNNIDLSPGSTTDIMGNLKIVVADNSSVVRFALLTERTDTYDVRGTIYPATEEWTPMNFGLNVGKTNIGFYYDIDEDIGTERLTIKSINGRSIPDSGLLYSTSPQEVSFSYSSFGKYQVIGFMADKYFAGYTGNTKPPSPSASIGTISVISQGQLHKILIDDEDKRTISVGSTLTLEEGYVLKAKDIDQGARTMLLSLLKDGSEIDSTPLSAGQTYVYTKRVGSVNDLPIIMVRFDSVFSGKEVSAAFLKGVFQISEKYIKVKTGDNYGAMKITQTGQDKIIMENDDNIDLSSGSTIELMGNIKFKVADSGTVRFYPFVTVTPEMVANQLTIDAPTKATAGDIIKLKITAGYNKVEGVSISIDPGVGTIENRTDTNGIINYTLPKTLKGIYNITATKLGYEKAIKNIEISQYIENRLSLDIPTTADQFETISIQVTSNSSNISGATITYDNDTIGTTNDKGILNYTFNSSGIHTILASKDGYVSTSRDVDIRAPYSEFRAKDISIIPNSTFADDSIIIRSNLTNVGTKADNKSIDLIINGTVINNKTVTLGPKEIKEIDFKFTVSLPEGNYTVSILEQEGLLEVKKSQINIVLLAVVITIIGAIVIYAATSKGKITKLIEKYRNRH